jgi:hypothetical protein
MNLAYMTRIGHWGYDNIHQFLTTISVRCTAGSVPRHLSSLLAEWLKYVWTGSQEMGLGAMEMLAMSLKVIRVELFCVRGRVSACPSSW